MPGKKKKGRKWRKGRKMKKGPQCDDPSYYNIDSLDCSFKGGVHWLEDLCHYEMCKFHVRSLFSHEGKYNNYEVQYTLTTLSNL